MVRPQFKAIIHHLRFLSSPACLKDRFGARDCHDITALKLAYPSCGGTAPICTLRSCAFGVLSLT